MSSAPQKNRHPFNTSDVVDADVVTTDRVEPKKGLKGACSLDHNKHHVTLGAHKVIDVDTSQDSSQSSSQSSLQDSSHALCPPKPSNTLPVKLSEAQDGVHQSLLKPLIAAPDDNEISEHLNSSFSKEFAAKDASNPYGSDIVLSSQNKSSKLTHLSDAESFSDEDLDDYDLDLMADDADLSGELEDETKELSFDEDDYSSYLSHDHKSSRYDYSADDDFYDMSGNSALDDEYDNEGALSGMHFMHESNDNAYEFEDNEDELNGVTLNKLLSMDPKKSIEVGLSNPARHKVAHIKNYDGAKAHDKNSNSLVINRDSAFSSSQDGYDFENDDELRPKEHLSSSTAIVRASNPNSIGSFVKAASQIPLLSEEEEHDLARRLRDFGDMDAARKLVLSHLRLVVSVARRYAGYGLPLSDLIQEGNIGLMKSVKHFDPNVGGRLAAFAVHWIKAEIHEYVIRNWRMVKVATTKAQRKLFFKLRQNKKRLGWFTEKERNQVASDLGVSSTDVAEMETRLAGVDIGFDIDDTDSSDHSTALTLAPSSYLEDENSDFAHRYEQNDYASWELKKLHDALNELDDRSRYILQRRWLDETKATLQELSLELKVSIERVRQLENNAMNKVKALLMHEGVANSEDESDKDKGVKLIAEPKKSTRGRKPRAKKTDAADESAVTDKEATSALSTAQDTSSNAEVKLLESKVQTPAKRGRKPKKAEAASNTSENIKALPHLKSEISHDKALVVTKEQSEH